MCGQVYQPRPDLITLVLFPADDLGHFITKAEILKPPILQPIVQLQIHNQAIRLMPGGMHVAIAQNPQLPQSPPLPHQNQQIPQRPSRVIFILRGVHEGDKPILRLDIIREKPRLTFVIPQAPDFIVISHALYEEEPTLARIRPVSPGIDLFHQRCGLHLIEPLNRADQRPSRRRRKGGEREEVVELVFLEVCVGEDQE